MGISYCKLNEFYEKIAKRRVICFGAGKNFGYFIDKAKCDIPIIVDSNKRGYFGEKGIKIVGWEEAQKYILQDDVLLITPADFEDIFNKVFHMDIFRDHDIYIYDLMCRLQEDEDRLPLIDRDVTYRQKKKEKIPRKIHYFWFSGDPYPDTVKKCLESWEKYCPNYEFIKWDMDNYDYKSNSFVYEAIKHQKWAFASDYGRADVIWRYGGIYLDLDVELVRNIDDLLYHDAFMGFQDRNYVDPGSGFGAIAGNDIVGEFLKGYENRSFVLDDGSLNLLPCPHYLTDILEKHGLVRDGSFQFVDDVAIYPFDYFCPHSYLTGRTVKTHNTYSIHHHQGAWVDEKTKRKEQLVYRFLTDCI